jgi:hypothetical protein
MANLSTLPMVLFLLVAACFNLPFFVRSLLDTFGKYRASTFDRMPSAPSALLATSFAELCWVLPCLVQCALKLFNGEGDWDPATSKTGCDIMGYYSVFGSIAGMTSTLWVALMTLCAVTDRKAVSASVGAVVSVAIIAFSAFISALPFMGVGSFAYTGEGFCYFDWFSVGLSTVMLLITLPTMLITLAIFAFVLHRGGWPDSLDIGLMAASFLSAWTLWVPACIIGLAGGSFPDRYMISGGVMGHAQAAAMGFEQ